MKRPFCLKMFLSWFAARWQDKREFGEPMWPSLWQSALWHIRTKEAQLRQFVGRIQGRLWPRGAWAAPVSVVAARRAGQEESHGISNFVEVCVPEEVLVDPTNPFTSSLSERFSPEAPLLSRRGFVCKLSGARLHVGEGLVVTRAKALLLDSAFASYRLTRSRVVGQPLPRKLPRVEGRVTAIHGLFDSNTFHWLVDALPRVHSLEMVSPEPLTLLLPDTASDYQLESLRLILPDSIEVRPMPSGWIEVEQFVFASYLTQAGCVSLPRTHSDAVRQRVWQRLGLSPGHIGTKRIFISRKGAPSRHVLNEDEVMGALCEFGFTSYCLEEMSFFDQVRLFHDAQIVVAPHGAGLANILFAPKIHVVELKSEMVLLHYFFLAQSLGHAYASVTSPPRRSDNLLVSVAELKRVYFEPQPTFTSFSSPMKPMSKRKITPPETLSQQRGWACAEACKLKGLRRAVVRAQAEKWRSNRSRKSKKLSPQDR